MGLDMYLSRRTYVKNWDHQKPEDRVKVTVTGGYDKGKSIAHIELDKISYIEEEVAYWRKANAIHKWFVDNVQGGEDECRPWYVSREQLDQLVEACEEVLADHSKAEKLLPSQAGFFFGGTDLDDWYFRCLQDTIDMLKPLVEDKDSWGEFQYRSSW